jgi:serine/threonine-protein phosphatase 4 regulatory subunit 1
LLAEDTKLAFVREVERVVQDAVYWVRREASFALGALAKVVPVEIVHSTLVRSAGSFATSVSPVSFAF